eukprot:6477092-Lingulodinium_polyedra.AAC.1
MAVLNQSKRALKQESSLRDPKVVGAMMEAAREVVRHRGVRIDDPAAQRTTLKSLTKQVEELTKESSAQAGDLG